MRAREDVFRERLGERLLRGDHVELVADAVIVGFARCVVGLAGGFEQSGGCLLLAQGGLHVGIRRPDFVADLVAQRVDAGLCCALLGLGLGHLALAASAVEEGPLHLQADGPVLRLAA